VVEEVIYREGYFKWLQLNKGDIVADIGANIGVFSVVASKYSKAIVAFEPDKDNYEIAKKNLELNNITNVALFNKAVTNDNNGIKLYLNNGVCSDCHTTYSEVRGREFIEVSSASFQEIIDKNNVNKVKMDCEGEELNILRKTNLSNIERMIFECHFKVSSRDKHKNYFEVLKNLENYFTTIIKPNKLQDDFSRNIKVKK